MDKYLHLLDYFVSQPYGIVDWLELPQEWQSLCLDACMDGYIESYCETETYRITESGREMWKDLHNQKD